MATWTANAAPWTAAVRGGLIDSRRLVTDRAIVDAVVDCAPHTVLDLGCGEGWLVRALTASGIQAIGVDASADLIDAARAAGDSDLRVASYDDIAAGRLAVRTDVVVSNFALIGKQSVERVVGAVPTLLNPRGAFIVQTLHPFVGGGDAAYQDGWRAGSWDGCGSGFSEPAPWYFRTLASWITLFANNGLRLVELHEPVHPKTRKPASVLFVTQAAT